jgi:hypothetical protein
MDETQEYRVEEEQGDSSKHGQVKEGLLKRLGRAIETPVNIGIMTAIGVFGGSFVGDYLGLGRYLGSEAMGEVRSPTNPHPLKNEADRYREMGGRKNNATATGLDQLADWGMAEWAKEEAKKEMKNNNTTRENKTEEERRECLIRQLKQKREELEKLKRLAEQEGLESTGEGFKPAKGYTWRNPKNPNDFSVIKLEEKKEDDPYSTAYYGINDRNKDNITSPDELLNPTRSVSFSKGSFFLGAGIDNEKGSYVSFHVHNAQGDSLFRSNPTQVGGNSAFLRIPIEIEDLVKMNVKPGDELRISCRDKEGNVLRFYTITIRE